MSDHGSGTGPIEPHDPAAGNGPGVCIVHAGMMKTGTTSIQSSLFRASPGDRFRLVTMDSYFGNVLVGSAFSGDYGIGERFISHGVTARAAATVPRQSRDYLGRALDAAARHACTPIVSAEIIGDLPRDGIERLRAFITDRGWLPQVIIYARAPLDLLESRFQQRLRAGDVPSRIPRRLPDYLDFSVRTGYARPLEAVDAVFGRKRVTMPWFDPRLFPGQCAVRHFCGLAGIAVHETEIVRENDALSLDAVRFLYAAMRAGRPESRSRLNRFRRAVLLARLEELRGPAIRFHPRLTAPFVARIGREMEWLEGRIGRPLSLSLRPRADDEGVREEADLLDFSDESLDWLARATGRRVARRGQGAETVRAVAEQLEAIGPQGSVRAACRVAMARIDEAWRCAKARRQNLR